MSSTTTAKTTVRDGLNSDILGKLADSAPKAPLGDILSVVLDAANPTVVVAATTVGAAVTPTGSDPAAQTGSTTSQANATTPANATYDQTQQTALADLANALKVLANQNVADITELRSHLVLTVADVATLATRLNQARVDILALRSELASLSAGTIGGATETGITVTSHAAVLAAKPTKNGLLTVRATAATTAGVKKLIRDPAHTLATGEVYWDGGLNLTFAAVDVVTACDVVYAKADLSQKASCLLQDMQVP